MKKIIALIFILSLLLVSCGDKNEGLTKAPIFLLDNQEGESLYLDELFDKPVVLNFWASWCPPCKAELPDFESAFLKYGDDVNFVMLDLVGSNDETEESAMAHIREKGYTFPVYFDTKGQGGYFYDIESIPQTFFINTDGYIEYSVKTMISASVLEHGISQITD